MLSTWHFLPKDAIYRNVVQCGLLLGGLVLANWSCHKIMDKVFEKTLPKTEYQLLPYDKKKYIVKNITSKKLQCILRKSKGILVEVEEADINLLIRTEIAIPSAILTYEPSICPESCLNYTLCNIVFY